MGTTPSGVVAPARTLEEDAAKKEGGASVYNDTLFEHKTGRRPGARHTPVTRSSRARHTPVTAWVPRKHNRNTLFTLYSPLEIYR